MRGECIDQAANPGLRVEPNFIDEKEEEELAQKRGMGSADGGFGHSSYHSHSHFPLKCAKDRYRRGE